MPSPRLQHTLNHFAAQHLTRERYLIEHDHENVMQANGSDCINFCSNDYLQIAEHIEIKKALIKGAEKYGLGSGASAMVAGYTRAHQQLEEACAEFLNRDRALLFNSGYHANLGVITTFANRNSVIIADKFCHASLIDAAVLSRAHLQRYRHNDQEKAEELLQNKTHQDALLLTESVFSIQGDIADVKKLATLANHYSAVFVVDDAHGVGVLGNHGGGICEHLQLSQHDVPCLITPFGKAFGSMGAVVSGSHETIEPLLQLARTYRYSTALPPAICCATQAALTIMQTETWRREKLKHLIQFFIQQANARGLNLYSQDQTPIKSITVGGNQTTQKIQKKLIQSGFFVSCIRPPTVPVNSACIRISLNCSHTETQLLNLLDSLQAQIEGNTHE